MTEQSACWHSMSVARSVPTARPAQRRGGCDAMARIGPIRATRRHSPRSAGFTFLEILVALLIVMILATVVGLNIAGRPGEARMAKARADIRTLQTAVEMYRADHGWIPTQEQGLEALCRLPDRPPIPRQYPDGGYLSTPAVPLDPWGRPYLYRVPGRGGERYEIFSYGADGDPGGSDENAVVSSSDT